MQAVEKYECNESLDLSHRDFKRLRQFIYDECGINISDGKKTMLEVRLRKRLKKLNLHSFSEYCEYLFSPDGYREELIDMIDQVTTNKTDFFREPSHFEYLATKTIPEFRRTRKDLVLWSAGCSSGEEPYTIAMFLNESHSNFKIFATDISTSVLEKARVAIYDPERVQPIPCVFKKKYLLINKDKTNVLYRIVPEIRNRVIFKRLNLMDSDYGLGERMDIIFCRNVIIYFDGPTREKILQNICACLAPDGYLFMGHSETLFGLNMPLTQVAPTIYRRNR
jgi:chemotaxis protein methyltransferase CheR